MLELGPGLEEVRASELPASVSTPVAATASSNGRGRLNGRCSDGDAATRDLADVLVGTSGAIQRVRELILRVAATDSTVLISGETGTGKELAARAIHRASRRAAGPFVAVNCAALTETLLESELFGHEKGAFTGAHALHKGRFELADGGTIFLDEIGSMALSLQAKLLRVLETRRFERVGGTHTANVDVRLIAATNSDLEQDVRRGAFRLDLYYRLQVITIVMPPLRERKDDIGLLARRFACDFCQGNGRRTINVSPEALALLVEHDWPGNVRELHNAVEHAFVLGTTGLIQADDLPESLRRRPGPTYKPALRLREAMAEAKKQIIITAFSQAGGSFTRAAEVLGVHPNNLFRLVRKMGLREILPLGSKPRLPAARQSVAGGFSQ